MDTFSFTEFVEFVRQWARLSEKKQITPESELEKHLGITGDDGRELLQAVEKRFNVTLFSEEHGYRNAFNLAPNEFLFNSDGMGLRPREEVVVALTVGELYRVVKDASAKNVSETK